SEDADALFWRLPRIRRQDRAAPAGGLVRAQRRKAGTAAGESRLVLVAAEPATGAPRASNVVFATRASGRRQRRLRPINQRLLCRSARESRWWRAAMDSVSAKGKPQWTANRSRQRWPRSKRTASSSAPENSGAVQKPANSSLSTV